MKLAEPYVDLLLALLVVAIAIIVSPGLGVVAVLAILVLIVSALTLVVERLITAPRRRRRLSRGPRR